MFIAEFLDLNITPIVLIYGNYFSTARQAGVEIGQFSLEEKFEGRRRIDVVFQSITLLRDGLL
jgi:hypothetical protein